MKENKDIIVYDNSGEKLFEEKEFIYISEDLTIQGSHKGILKIDDKIISTYKGKINSWNFGKKFIYGKNKNQEIFLISKSGELLKTFAGTTYIPNEDETKSMNLWIFKRRSY